MSENEKLYKLLKEYKERRKPECETEINVVLKSLEDDIKEANGIIEDMCNVLDRL